MPFQRIQPERLSASVVDQIELLILRGVLRPGERLPAERELSERLGVSRPSLREALAALQDNGLIVARPNAGIFVSDDLNSALSPALTALFGRHDEAVFDYLDFRRDIEGLAAERAAEAATETDLDVIASIFARMEAAHAKRDGSTEAALDADFHLAIIEAGHNIVMLHLMRAMFDLLRNGVFYNRQIMFQQRTTRTMLLDQHRAIHAAIRARDPAAARGAVEAHLGYVREALTEQLRTDHIEQVAQQRLASEKAR